MLQQKSHKNSISRHKILSESQKTRFETLSKKKACTLFSSCARQDTLEANDRCRTWYNETTLEGLQAPSRPPGTPGGGIPLDTT